MSGTPIANDAAKQTVGSVTNVDVWATEFTPAQRLPSVYAAFWQARSGFFSPSPKKTLSSTNIIVPIKH